MKKTTQKYADIIKSGRIAENEVIYMRKHINNPETPLNEKEYLLELLNHEEPKLTTEHSEKGRAYLLGKQFTQSGKLRKQAPLTETQAKILQGERLTHKLVDLIDQGNVYQWDVGLMPTLPLYEAESEHGSFQYIGKAINKATDFVAY